MEDTGRWVVAVIVVAAIVALLALAGGTADHPRSHLGQPTAVVRDLVS
ncbi:MAG TPA: hypothetical protein VIC63_04295 [Candidatus Limnocylindria bacterium]